MISHIILIFICVLTLIILITAIGSLCVLVPCVPTPMPVVKKMIDFAALKPHDTVYDLGCGDARILIESKKQEPKTTCIGYELPLGVWMLAKFRVWWSGFSIDVRMRDLWSADLRDADVVCLYLFPEVCHKLQKKLDAELQPGTRVVSHGFELKDRTPERMERVPLSSWNLIWGGKKEGPRVFLYVW